MTALATNTLYSRSGGILTRSLFCRDTLASLYPPGQPPQKTLFVFDSFSEVKSYQKFLEYLLGNPVRNIANVSDTLQYMDATTGFFCATTGMFDAAHRYEYLRQKTTLHIDRGVVMPSRALVERLIELGFEHSPHLARTFTYHIQGSEMKLRDGHRTIHMSYFDDEIDDLLIGGGEGSATPPARVTEVTLYSRESAILSETCDTIQPIGSGFVWTFDLDFYAHRDELRGQFADWVGFESSGVPLGVSPISFESLEDFGKFIRDYGNKTQVYTSLVGSVNRYLEYNGLAVAHVVQIPKIRLESDQSEEFVYITDDILGPLFVEKRSRKQSLKSLDLLMTLKPGDYVVHQEHGIGKFTEMVEKNVMGINREYVAIAYAKEDRLYVPITELYRVTKYLGEESPKLHELGGTVWKKTLKDTEAEVLKTAEELLDIYARRKIAPGYAFGRFPEKEEAFKLAFPYSHTADQATSIEEIFEDMEKPEPMDRLLCGDVGFGKTEVAMNAAYKAVLSGKQVAVISPLVVLTLEHYDSFTKRFAEFNIKIACLSRLSSAKEVTAALQGIKDGSVQVIVGTHRLLGADVQFARLGLLVIDEEHRFGVIDKEKIKRLRSGIDILSLSATPIPRSLNLSLSGLKKLSILTTPPPNKKPIDTQVIKWNEITLREVMQRELDRGGQVIFLHNRVASLTGTAKEIERIAGRKLHPLMLHGQMKSEQIENTLLEFRSGKSNCLVSTTVIENGVNFLNANTIIIDHADEFGLAQLHQLRGRVGRKDRDAHCLLVYRKDILPDDSKKRLISLVEYAHLGAGFEIAMRDLEIRGAGEILGIAQSGKSRETGVSLYLKLLENKMQELQTGTVQHTMDIKIELDIQFVLPDTLFNGDVDKIHFYRSLEGIDNIEDLESSEASLVQAHGPNVDVERLFLLLKARILLSAYGVNHLKKVLKDYVFDFRGATTQDIRDFLEVDAEGNFLVQNLDRVRVAQNLYTGDLDFLSKLVYSLTNAPKH